MVLSRTVSEINGDSSRKSQIFPTPVRLFCAPTEGVLPLELVPALAVKKLEWWATGPIRKYDDIFNRLDTMHQCDRRTDRRADIGWQQRPRWRIASRGNKTSHNLMYSDF